MKKSVVSALTTALVVGATATTFAAANPFSDVPSSHWAYKSVSDLAAKGIIEGYTDANGNPNGIFLGERNITRYEMAQMVAKALAKNPSGATKAELDRLAAEFRDELDSLGVRVSELEKHADKVQWTGKIEYTYNHHRLSGDGERVKTMNHDGVFRLEPKAEINDHWTAVARFDANYSGRNDETGYIEKDGTKAGVKLKRVYAEGNYDRFNVKLGRFGFCPDYEDGLVVDTVISGIDLNFGSKWKVDLVAGRTGKQSDEAHFGSSTIYANATWVDENGNVHTLDESDSDIVRLGVQYGDPGDKGFYGGVGYVWAKDDDFRALSKDGENNKAQVYSLNLGYRFSDLAKLWGSVARNSKATNHTQKTSWQLEFRYGNYGDYANKGDWAAWVGYSKFSWATAVATGQGDDISTGEKGWHIGVAYAPFKNTGILLRYADAKEIDTGVKDRHFWGRVEFFF
jgi:hypothetical protein